MRRKGILLSGLAVATAAAAVAIGLTIFSGPSVTRLQSPIVIFPHMIFAPPPANAAPKMTWDQVMTARHLHPLPLFSHTTVRLGLFSNAIQPYTGPHSVTEDGPTAFVRNGYVYDDAMPYHELVYGVSTPVCSPKPGKPEGQCTSWDFFNANTGRFVRGSIAEPGPPSDRNL